MKRGNYNSNNNRNNNGLGPNSILKLQDMLDILYTINRIMESSNNVNNEGGTNRPSSSNKSQNIIKNFHHNTNGMTNPNIDMFINLLREMDSLNRRNNYIDHNKYRRNRNSSNYNNGGDESFSIVDKIKLFLNSLNDE